MSAMSFALLLTTATATAVGAAALFTARGLRRRWPRCATSSPPPGRPPTSLLLSVPHARTDGAPAAEAAATADEIRTAVAEALAEEREREPAEARAFWAAQEARDAADSPRPSWAGPPPPCRPPMTRGRTSCPARRTSPAWRR